MKCTGAWFTIMIFECGFTSGSSEMYVSMRHYHLGFSLKIQAGPLCCIRNPCLSSESENKNTDKRRKPTPYPPSPPILPSIDNTVKRDTSFPMILIWNYGPYPIDRGDCFLT